MPMDPVRKSYVDKPYVEQPTHYQNLVYREGLLYPPMSDYSLPNLLHSSNRFFVIKSYTEDDIYKSVQHGVWASTDMGNRRLDRAFRDALRTGGNVFLFFSVNASGHFCGIAQMISSVDHNTLCSFWTEAKWKGRFEILWLVIKDVPNSVLRHLRLINNDGKPLTCSRDTQEVKADIGLEVFKVFDAYNAKSSIINDYEYFENR